MRTGEGDEERVEEVVAESVIHEHEEAAELFLPLSAGMLLLAAGGLLKGGPGRVARAAAPFGALLLLVAGYRVGHTGGGLVYEYGAASAYVTTSPASVDVADRDPEHRDSDDADRDLDEDH